MKTLLTAIERQKMFENAQATLWEESEDSNEALKYLRETRRLTDDVIKSFRFGYCPRRARHDWAGRLIMPLFDPYENLVVLTTREFRTIDKDKMPHLHEKFDKKRYLFGIDIAKQHIISANKAIIVEGQFDTTFLHSCGINMTVGVLGSALSFDHISQLRRYCSEYYLVFDNDDAGLSSLERAMDMYHSKYLVGYGIIFVPVILPKPAGSKKMDPDDFVKQNGTFVFNEVLAEAKNKTLQENSRC